MDEDERNIIQPSLEERLQNAEKRHQEYLNKLRIIIEQECDGSRMSNTKWKKMLSALHGLPIKYRVKFLDTEKVTNWGWLTWVLARNAETGAGVPYIEGSFSPDVVLAVEWLEIDPNADYRGKYAVATDYRAVIEQQLQALNVPYTMESSLIRVIGHVRKSPEFRP